MAKLVKVNGFEIKISKKDIEQEKVQYFFYSDCKKLNTFFRQLRKRYNDMYMKYIYKQNFYEKFVENNGNLQIITNDYVLHMFYDWNLKRYYFNMEVFV